MCVCVLVNRAVLGFDFFFGSSFQGVRKTKEEEDEEEEKEETKEEEEEDFDSFFSFPIDRTIGHQVPGKNPVNPEPAPPPTPSGQPGCGFYQVLPSFYRVFPSHRGFYLVLPGFPWMLTSFSGVFCGFDQD